MSMSLRDLLEWNYFPYYTKEELLEIVKKWQSPESARDYILEYYDKRKKEREETEIEFKKILNKKTWKQMN